MSMYRIKVLGTDQATAMLRTEEVRKAGAELRKVFVPETVFVVERQNHDGSWNDWRLLEEF